jgi:quinol monooxygenase YgiN
MLEPDNRAKGGTMFIQILQGRVADEAGVRREVARWHGELGTDAPGWLGLTAGVGDDRTFMVVLRFTSEAAVRANDRRPELTAWRAAVKQHLVGPVRLDQCPVVRTPKAGSPARAGFVRVLQGRVADPVRLATLQGEVDRALQRQPHLLEVVVGEHEGGQGYFTEIASFVSERAVRAAERAMPVESAVQLGMVRSFMERVRQVELHDPWVLTPPSSEDAILGTTGIPAP